MPLTPFLINTKKKIQRKNLQLIQLKMKKLSAIVSREERMPNAVIIFKFVTNLCDKCSYQILVNVIDQSIDQTINR